jgi:hypothetical protein
MHLKHNNISSLEEIDLGAIPRKPVFGRRLWFSIEWRSQISLKKKSLLVPMNCNFV